MALMFSPFGMPMMGPMYPMMGGPAPPNRRKKAPLDVTKWKEWTGEQLAQWLSSLKLPPGVREAYHVIAKNIMGSMLPTLELEDLTSLQIKRPHAKLILEKIQELKKGQASSVEEKHDDEEDDDDAPVPDLEPFHLPQNLPSEKFDFFLSHRGPDTKDILVRPLANMLHNLGISCFFDREIEVGLSNEEAVARGLYQSQYGLVFLSPSFLNSKWCVKELLTLTSRSQHDPTFKAIVPVFCSVATDLSNINPRAKKILERYKKEIKAVTHRAGIELHCDTMESLRTEVVKKLIPELFKLMKKPVPESAELQKVSCQTFTDGSD